MMLNVYYEDKNVCNEVLNLLAVQEWKAWRRNKISDDYDDDWSLLRKVRKNNRNGWKGMACEMLSD